MHFVTRFLTVAWAALAEVPEILASANPWLLALLVLAATLWLGAASWGAAVAEKRHLPPVRHFLLGLLLPFAYPFVLLSERKTGVDIPAPAPAAAPAASAAAAAAPPETVPAASVPAPDRELGFGPEFFEQLRQAGWVTEANPCTVRFNGQEINASGILEALPEAVVVETRKADGTPQRVRIPYARIQEVIAAGAAGAAG